MPRVSRPQPPPILYRIVNPTLRALLRSPLARFAPDGLALITFTGRRTGRTYTTPVGTHRDGQDRVVFTDSPWYRNLEGGRSARLRVGGETVEGPTTVIADADEWAGYMRRRLEAGADPRRLGFQVEGEGLPSVEELKAGLPDRVMLRIRAATD